MKMYVKDQEKENVSPMMKENWDVCRETIDNLAEKIYKETVYS